MEGLPKKSRDIEEKTEINSELPKPFQDSKKKYYSKGLTMTKIIETNSSFLLKYEEINRQYLKNKEEINKICEKMSYNMEITDKAKIDSLGQELFTLLTEFKDDNPNTIVSDPPALPFNQSLTDEKFIELVSEAKEYALKNKKKYELSQIENKFKKEEKNIKSLFSKAKIVKDILQNAILTILINKCEEKDLNNNFSLLSIDDITFMPLVNLPFDKNEEDLNKNNLIDIAISHIPLLTFNKTMKNFIKSYKYNKKELKIKIKNYIESHEVYFSSFEDNIHGLTIHTGDIFINLKYIKEYFDINNKSNKLIIRTKIVMVFLHELNHGLIRDIDEEKKGNFFNNSKKNKANGKTELKFKGLNKGDLFFLPLNESGNYFDFLLYGGYYLDTINIKFASFLLNMKNITKKKTYIDKLKRIITKIQPDSNTSICKFKIGYGTCISQCGLSFMRSSQLRNIPDDKSDNENSDMDISEEQNSEEDFEEKKEN